MNTSYLEDNVDNDNADNVCSLAPTLCARMFPAVP